MGKFGFEADEVAADAFLALYKLKHLDGSYCYALCLLKARGIEHNVDQAYRILKNLWVEKTYYPAKRSLEKHFEALDEEPF